MKQKKGLLITFEGGEGCGKSTHVNLLRDYLKNKGFEVLIIREPGGTKTGEKLRKILLEEKSEIAPLTELLLFLASRRELTVKVIKPALQKGIIIICDRFMDSTVAYQGYGRGIDIKLISKLNNMVVGKETFPDLTFILDTDKHLGFKLKGKDRIEVENEFFHKKVRRGYLEIAKQEPKRVKLIEVDGKIEEIQNKIRGIAEKYLNLQEI